MKAAKLFPNGQSQAVRLPREFRFRGREVLVAALDGAVILLPKGNPWQPLLASLSRFSPDFGRKPKGRAARTKRAGRKSKKRRPPRTKTKPRRKA
jgi:antitoxin VapB